MYIRTTLEFFKKIQMPRNFFFLQSSSYDSNKQPCLKTTGLYDDLSLLSSLFHLFNFIFNAPISFNSCFPISPFFLLFWFHKIFMLLFIICFHVLFNIPHCNSCIGQLQLQATNFDMFSFHFYSVTNILYFYLLWLLRYICHLEVDI